MKPVAAIAHAIRRSPHKDTSTWAMRCAAPDSTTILPSIAPATITIAKLPSAAPIPFRTAPATSAGGMPRASAAPAETRMKARKG
jgi:hypothetical protein